MTIKCFRKRQFLSKRSLSSVPLKDRRKIHRFRTFYQVHNMVIALPVSHYFQQSLRLTRSRSTHIQPNSRHDCHLLSFFPRTVKDWNLIPFTKVIEIFVITLAIIFKFILYFLLSLFDAKALRTMQEEVEAPAAPVRNWVSLDSCSSLQNCMIITLLLFFFFLSYTNQGVIGTGYFCSSRFSDEVCSTVAELVTCTRILWQKTKVCNRCYLNTALYFSLLFF